MRRWIITLALLAALTGPARAWHQDGHMAIALIAWNDLSDAQRTYFTKVLKEHPHYDVFLTADRPPDVPEPLWAFARAACWSDWVRDPKASNLAPTERRAIRDKFNKPVWHYVNLPYIHPAEPDKFDATAIRKEILEPSLDSAGEPRNVVAALAECKKHLTADDTPAPERAVWLCWLLHLTGDLHQPLHGTALIASAAQFDPKFDPPHGDLGGNRLAIKAKAEDTKAMNLHFYWDSLLFAGDPPFSRVDEVVTGMRADPDLKREQFPELAETRYLAWAEESLALAKKVVYQDGDQFLKARSLPPRTNLEGFDAPLLSDAYRKAAEATARRRMVLAGYRIADQLKDAAKAP